MVDVALVVSLAVLFFFVVTPFHPKHGKWYKKMIKHWDVPSNSSGGGGGEKNKRKLFRWLSMWWLKILWFLFAFSAFVALYIYFDGNCFFNQPRIFDEDDEVGTPGWDRGLVVLIFFLTICFLLHLWIHFFFNRRWFAVAFFVCLLMVAMAAVCLWAMATTPMCRGDTITNRFWISFGLYLIFTIWCVVLGLFSLNWYRTIGGRLTKHHNHYPEFRKRKKDSRKSYAAAYSGPMGQGGGGPNSYNYVL